MSANATPAHASLLSRLLLILCLLTLVALMLSGLGSRWDWWHFSTGFQILRWGTWAAIGLSGVTLALLLYAIFRRQRRNILVLAHALPMVLIPAGYVYYQYQAVQHVPPIHDITTDPDSPPAFHALPGVPERSLTYDRDNVLPQQQQAYPDIVPMLSDDPPDRVFERALEAARALGWELAEVDGVERRFQAVDTTFWFGFKDDIVVRVQPADAEGTASRLDVRSASRVGRSDVGANAERIRRFMDEFGRH